SPPTTNSPMRFSLILLSCTFTLTSFARPDATVAADGSGNYTSVQAAIDAAPVRSASAAPWEIHVKPGTYRERVQIARTHSRLLLRGDDAETTTITFN